MPRMDNMSLISGSYNGYVFNMNNMKEVSILKNDKRYVFMFINDDYFIKEYIEDILNTVVIK